MKNLDSYTIKSLQKRLLVLTMLITFVFVTLFFRLAFLQVFSSKFLNVKAKEQWLRDIPLKATRGDIFDTNGVCLASDYSTYDIYVRANSVLNPVEVANYLSSYLEIEFEKVFIKVTNKKVSEVLIKTQVERSVAAPLIEKNLAGVYFSINSKRYYTFGDFLTQVLGYTTIDGVGQSGLEAFYNSYLTGVDGKVLSESDVRGRQLNTNLTYYEEPIKGLNLNLTIDCQIQNIIENILSKIMSEQLCKSATCIVMNPNNGEVLGMSTKNSFNLNDVPRDNIDLLNELSKIYSTQNVVEPGSTFKLFTISAALELGLAHEDDRFYCPGYRIVDGQKIKCWKTIGHGSQTLVEGICNSCNCVFMDLAQRIGVDKLYEYIKNFGFGSKTNIDLFAETGGILMPQSKVKNVDLVRIGFGHAIAVSPIQMICGVNSIVNGGSLISPRLVKSITNDNGEVKVFEQQIKNQTINSNTAQRVKEMMLAVVEHSNGANAGVVGYKIGGKTGTAQKYENGVIAQGKYVSSFIGFAPYNNPTYSVLVMVDEPGAGVYYGSIVAAPYAKEIFSNIFDVKNINKTNEENEILECVMPDLIGKNLAVVMNLINKAGLQLEIDGDGTIVKSQFPQAGAKLKRNAVVFCKTTQGENNET